MMFKPRIYLIHSNESDRLTRVIAAFLAANFLGLLTARIVAPTAVLAAIFDISCITQQYDVIG